MTGNETVVISVGKVFVVQCHITLLSENGDSVIDINPSLITHNDLSVVFVALIMVSLRKSEKKGEV